MKSLSKFIIGALAAAALTGFTACQDDFDNKVPALNEPVATLKPNTSILELKEIFWQNAVNYIDTIRLKDNGEHYIIAGRVISSDMAGNVYKKLVIQDQTAAIALSINANSLYNEYRIGQEIVIDATDMYIGKYNGTEQLGFPMFYEKNAVWEATFMPYEFFVEHMQLNGFPDASKIDTLTIRSFSDLPVDPSELAKYQSRIVRFNNVHFEDGGQKEYTDGYKVNTNRLLFDADNRSVTVRTSGYATFRDQLLPAGNGDVVALLDYYATSEDADSPWQLTLNNTDGCINFGNPTIEPGGEDNPYTVAQTIELQKKSDASKGWLTGYIVGAVAPEVTEVTSNDDIEWTADVVLANTLVIGPSADCKNYDECVVISLPQDSKLRQVGNLRDNPDNYGKQIWVYGTFAKYMGTWGVTGNSGSTAQFRIEGIDPEGGNLPAGDGTEASPYNCAQVIASNPTSTTESPAGFSGVWITGYIVGYMPSSGTYLDATVFGIPTDVKTNIVIGPTADCTDYTQCVGIQLPNTSVRADLNLQDNPGNLGAKVNLYGDVMKYCGGPGLKNTSKYTISGQGSGGGDDPTPPTPGNPEGDGTLASPYNVARALEIILSGAASESEVYLTGIISKIDNIDTGTYGNATYFISDDGSTTTQLEVFRGYGLDGAKFTTGNEIKVGDKVVILGKLVYYNNSVAEVTSGSKIISLNGQGGSQGGGGDEPTPPTPGDNTKDNPYVCSQVIALNPTSTSESPAGGSGVWVTGYIVGYMPANGTYLNKTIFEVPTDVKTNLVLGPTPDCTDYNLCIGVQLPNNAVRADLNLVDHPELLKAEVLLYGDVMKYCGAPGLKNTSQYELK